MRQEDAETIALKALSWLLADEKMLEIFCGATGTAPGDLRLVAQDPEFLAGVLDFVALDDAWVMAFATVAGLPPDALIGARVALPGGALPHWT